MRFQSQERTANRKLEREALQYKSKQALTNPEVTGRHNLVHVLVKVN
jgi:hypothetical protein